MPCFRCEHWYQRDVTQYDDGTEIVTRQSPDGKGRCLMLGIETDPDFACNKFFENQGSSNDLITPKAGSPWQHFVMITCPKCQGGPGCGGQCDCAGTGLVRKYDDGFIGDEKTRKHPKEVELAKLDTPKCRACGHELNSTWVACPVCGERVYIPMAKTEVIEGMGNAGEVPGQAEAVKAARNGRIDTLRAEIVEQNERAANPPDQCWRPEA